MLHSVITGSHLLFVDEMVLRLASLSSDLGLALWRLAAKCKLSTSKSETMAPSQKMALQDIFPQVKFRYFGKKQFKNDRRPGVMQTVCSGKDKAEQKYQALLVNPHAHTHLRPLAVGSSRVGTNKLSWKGILALSQRKHEELVHLGVVPSRTAAILHPKEPANVVQASDQDASLVRYFEHVQLGGNHEAAQDTLQRLYLSVALMTWTLMDGWMDDV